MRRADARCSSHFTGLVASVWTVLGEDDVPVAPVDRYLRYLTDIERSPKTVKAYAHDLKDWFGFLVERGLDWRAVRLEDVGEFVAWLRLPLQARDGCVAVLPTVPHHCTESTVNRKLSAVSAFYIHAARDGVAVGELLTSWRALLQGLLRCGRDHAGQVVRLSIAAPVVGL